MNPATRFHEQRDVAANVTRSTTTQGAQLTGSQNAPARVTPVTASNGGGVPLDYAPALLPCSLLPCCYAEGKGMLRAASRRPCDPCGLGRDYRAEGFLRQPRTGLRDIPASLLFGERKPRSTVAEM